MKQALQTGDNGPQVEQPWISPIEMFRSFDKFDVLCIVAVLLSFAVTSRLPFAPSKYSDAYFHDEAKQLVRVVKGVDGWDQIHMARAPGPVLYYAVPYMLVQTNAPEKSYWQAAFIWNVLWMVVAILLIRRAGDSFWSPQTGKLAAILSIVVPFGIYYSFGIAGETPAYVAAAIFVYGWARWREKATARIFGRTAILPLFGLVALVLCRPNALIVLGIVALCAVALWVGNKVDERRQAGFAVLCLAIVSGMILCTSLVLKQLPSQKGVGTQASNFADVLFFGSFQFRNEPWDWRFWGKATRQGSADYENWIDTRKELVAESAEAGTPVAKLEMQWAIRDIISHPITRMKMFLVRVLALNIWIEGSTRPSAFAIGPFQGLWVYIVFHIALNLIALLSVGAAIWFAIVHRQEMAADWPLWGVWLSLLLFHAFTYSEPRYMLPAQPGLAILAAAALNPRRAAKS
jgi:hypothetical protein